MLAKDSEFVDYPLALLVVDFRIKRWLDSRIGMRGCGLETDAADIEIFLEAIELQTMKAQKVQLPSVRRPKLAHHA